MRRWWAPSSYASKPQSGSLPAYSQKFAQQEFKHTSGKSLDVQSLDENGHFIFDQAEQNAIGAAATLSKKIAWGGDWLRNKDHPHFEADSMKDRGEAVGGSSPVTLAARCPV